MCARPLNLYFSALSIIHSCDRLELIQDNAIKPSQSLKSSQVTGAKANVENTPQQKQKTMINIDNCRWNSMSSPSSLSPPRRRTSRIPMKFTDELLSSSSLLSPPKIPRRDSSLDSTFSNDSSTSTCSSKTSSSSSSLASLDLAEIIMKQIQEAQILVDEVDEDKANNKTGGSDLSDSCSSLPQLISLSPSIKPLCSGDNGITTVGSSSTSRGASASRTALPPSTTDPTRRTKWSAAA